MTAISENSYLPIRDEGLHLATSEIFFKRILIATDFSKPSAKL